MFCWVLLFSPTPDLTFMQKINSEKQTSLSTCSGRLEETGTIRNKLTTYTLYYLTVSYGLAVYRAAEANNDPVFFG